LILRDLKTITETGNLDTCGTTNFGDNKQYWAENNPPGTAGGAIEFNCATIQMRDARYANDKNWVAQRCDVNYSGRDQYVCQRKIPQSTCKNGKNENKGETGKGHGEPRNTLNLLIPIILFYLFIN
jgi:hypothetical protein